MCRKLIYLISFVLVLGLCPHLAHGEAGLVGYWKLDESSGATAADSAGGDNDGTLGGFRLQWKPSGGKVGGALSYGGDPQAYVAFPTTGMLTTAGTVALWGYLDDPQPGQTRYFFGHTTIPSWANRIQIYMDDPANMLDIGLGNTHSHARDLLSLETQTWYHIALTWDDAGTCVVYVNGEEMTRGPYSGLNTLNTEADIGNDGDRDGRDEGFGGLIDEVRLYNRALTQDEIQKVMTFLPVLATNPSPAYEATDVPRDVVLSWTPGIYAPAVNGHTVYFSESFDDVNAGIGGVTQSAANYAVPQRLDLSTTYYWRVDEVNNVNPDSPWIGNVWSFTTEPFAYPIDNITATASSQFNADTGPENTINRSGLDDNDLHSKEQVAIWVSSMTGPQPTWIQYEFDRVYKLHQMWVWNHNTAFERVVGLGIKDATIEYSIDGANWTTLGTTHEFVRAPGADAYAHDTTIDLSGAVAKYVRIIANSNWGGIVPQYGLSEVRFFYVPVHARAPYPDIGATDVDVDVTLGFRAGREAAQHDVYLSSDQQAVIDGTAPVNIVTEAGHGPLSLDLGKTYYWRVDEVNEARTPATWQGDLWSFTTREFLVVDDFESYNDLDITDPESNRIFLTWIDGLDQPTNGSIVGYANLPFAEQTIVYSGKQSMPLSYDNTGTAAYSEAERTFVASQNWTEAGAATLVLYFHGTEGNTGQLYVKVNGTKVAYDAGNLALSSWQVWNIDLASLGAGLQNVTKLAIGIDGNGASGKLLLDDIRLYRLAPAPPVMRIAASSDDAEEHVLDGGTMEVLDSSDLELGYEGAMAPEGLQTIGCRWVGIPVPKGATITEAWVQFSADDVDNDYHIPDVSLIIEGELSPNPATFSSTAGDISSRPTTTAQVVWDIPQWMTVHAKGPEERTPDISSIIQEIVNQDGWAGSAIVLMFRDNPAKPSAGTREAESFDGSASEAPLLHISYQ
jgi:hypothetical protein